MGTESHVFRMLLGTLEPEWGEQGTLVGKLPVTSTLIRGDGQPRAGRTQAGQDGEHM